MRTAVIVMFASWCVLATHSAEIDHAYVKLGRVLTQHVHSARVDYAALKRAPAELNAALDEMVSVSRADFDKWSQSRQISFLINIYNASTLRLVVDHYPVKSIKDIGGILRGPFKQRAVRVFGERVTLDDVEHGMLRASYREPRVHFALVCAAKSCPPLRPEPYLPERLDAQLEEQGRLFLGDTSRNRFDAKAGVLYLSPIFKWFREDFEDKGGSVVKFVTPFFPAETRRSIEGTKSFTVRYTNYDWSLNSQP